jgi:hypothetical protein
MLRFGLAPLRPQPPQAVACGSLGAPVALPLIGGLQPRKCFRIHGLEVGSPELAVGCGQRRELRGLADPCFLCAARAGRSEWRAQPTTVIANSMVERVKSFGASAGNERPARGARTAVTEPVSPNPTRDKLAAYLGQCSSPARNARQRRLAPQPNAGIMD